MARNLRKITHVTQYPNTQIYSKILVLAQHWPLNLARTRHGEKQKNAWLRLCLVKIRTWPKRTVTKSPAQVLFLEKSNLGSKINYLRFSPSAALILVGTCWAANIPAPKLFSITRVVKSMTK